MNAAHQHNQPPGLSADVLASALGENLSLSALADGEASPSELDALLAAGLERPAAVLEDWHAYQVIGDVLRGHADATGSTPANDFLAAVRLGMRAQDAGPGVAVLQSGQVASVRKEAEASDAANDPVFRWKLVAGFASVAAVMAVSWSVLVGSGGSLDGASGSQLALTAPGAASTPVLQPTAVATADAPSTPAQVVVNTGQGVLIRDAQLEALLAEHRQHGGMSALQMPSGFIRNATYDAAGR